MLFAVCGRVSVSSDLIEVLSSVYYFLTSRIVRENRIMQRIVDKKSWGLFAAVCLTVLVGLGGCKTLLQTEIVMAGRISCGLNGILDQ